MRSKFSTALELAGAALVSGGVATAASRPLGAMVAGGFCLLFGWRMGNA